MGKEIRAVELHEKMIFELELKQNIFDICLENVS